jgi:hypothetical protein
MSISRTTSWLSETEEALHLAVRATDTRTQIADLEDTKAALDHLLDEFRRIARADAVARSTGWGGRGPNPDLFDDLKTANESLDPRPMVRSMRGLERYGPDLRGGLIEYWHQHAAARMGNVIELQDLAETLSRVEGVAALSRDLAEVLGELARTQQDLPTQSSADLLREAETKLKDLEEALNPAPVRRFLSAVARGGASVELLTEDVDAWLREHRALASFRIVPGAPSEDANV